MAVPLVLALAAGFAAAAVAPEVTKTIRREVLEPEDVRGFLRTEQARQLSRTGYNAVERINQENLLQQGVSFIPGAQAFDKRRQRAYYDAVVSELKRDPRVTDAQADKLANSLLRAEFQAGGSGEIAGNLGASAIAERIGQRAFTRFAPQAVERAVLKKPINPLAVAGAKSAAVGGAFEGSAVLANEDISRRRFGQQEEGVVKLGKKGSFESRATAQLERQAIAGGAGAATAGVLGGIITGQSLGRPRVSKTVDTLASIFDPFEKPGEALERAIPSKVPQKVITITNTPQANIPKKRPVMNLEALLSGNRSRNDFVSEKAKAQLDALFSNPVQTKSQINTQQVTGRRSPVLSIVPSNPKQTQIPSLEDVLTPPTKEPPVRDDRFTENPESTKEETQTETPTQTTTSNIPTSSAIFRGGVPLPPLFGIPPGGGGRRVYGRRSRFINELEQAAKIYRRIL